MVNNNFLNERIIRNIASSLEEETVSRLDLGRLIDDNKELSDLLLMESPEFLIEKDSIINDEDLSNRQNLRESITDIIEEETMNAVSFKRSKKYYDAVDNLSFEDFIKYMYDSIVVSLKKKEDLIKVVIGNEFKVGDLIVMNEEANSRYSITRSGSEGQITKKDGEYFYMVRFSKLTGKGNKDSYFSIEKEYMSLRKTIKELIEENGGIEKYTERIIDTSINRAVLDRFKKEGDYSKIDRLIGVLIDLNIIYTIDGQNHVNMKKVERYSELGAYTFDISNFKISKSSSKPFKPKYVTLAKKGLYISENMNAPLAEQLENVAQFELTVGCSHNVCTYCDLFKGMKFFEKSEKDFNNHVDAVLGYLKNGHKKNLFSYLYDENNLVDSLTRIFIGGGDALSVETDKLNKAIKYTISAFKKYTGRLPKRVAMYGSVSNIIKQGSDGLGMLHCGGECGMGCSMRLYGDRKGLDVVYLGLETGNDELLRELKKGHNEEQLYKAIRILNSVKTTHSELNVSSFVMPGIGGEKYRHSHVDSTLNALRYLEPKFINLMSIKEHAGSAYSILMNRAEERGENRRLSRYEIGEQIADFVEGLNFPTTIGCYDNSCYLGEDTNVVHFPSISLSGLGDQIILADVIRNALRTNKNIVDIFLGNRLNQADYVRDAYIRMT